MGNPRKIFLIMFMLNLLLGCVFIPEDPDATTSTFLAAPGDIAVLNYATRQVVILDQNGQYKSVLYTAGANEQVLGLGWMHTTNEFLLVISGASRVMAVSAIDGASRILVSDTNFATTANTVAGVTQLSGGDVIVAEGAGGIIERFTASGVRVATGGWPRNSGHTVARQLTPLSNGGFVSCSIASDVVQNFNSSGVAGTTGASGVAGTTDAYACTVLSTGEVAVAWTGTTDTVQIKSATLASNVATYNNTVGNPPTPLNDPRAIAEARSGNILIADYATHIIHEISPNGAFIRHIAFGFLNQPSAMVVVPDFNF